MPLAQCGNERDENKMDDVRPKYLAVETYFLRGKHIQKRLDSPVQKGQKNADQHHLIGHIDALAIYLTQFLHSEFSGLLLAGLRIFYDQRNY